MLRNYETWGVTNYTVADETFNDRPSKITKFANVVETLPFEPFYTGFIRADLLVSRPTDRIDLARMNFRGHYYGVESFNTASAKSVGKGMKAERLQEGLIDVRKYFETTGNGLYCGTIGLIIGLPHETKETITKSQEWLNKNWNGQSFAVYPLIIPSLELENKSKMFDYEKYGYTKMQNTAEVSRIPISLFNEGICWQNEHMTMVEAYDMVFDKFYNKQFVEGGNFKITNFEMAGYSYGNTSTQNRLNKISHTMLASLCESGHPEYITKQLYYETHRDIFIEQYKQRKLSL